jgi:hypothetical protein
VLTGRESPLPEERSSKGAYGFFAPLQSHAKSGAKRRELLKMSDRRGEGVCVVEEQWEVELISPGSLLRFTLHRDRGEVGVCRKREKGGSN